MSFTGSPEVGRATAAACGRNLVPVKLELGGKGAAVVFDDTDLVSTANQLVDAVTFNAGQACGTATRWLIHDSVYDDFIDLARERMTVVRTGYWSDPDTDMGPLVSETHMRRVLGYVEAARAQGAEVLTGGDQPSHLPNQAHGYYVQPVMLTGKPDNIAAQEEIFGPVPFVIRFRDEADAVQIVNESPYGLANSVWSGDVERAGRVAEALVAGSGWINAHNVFLCGVPYGGVNLSGMGGGVLGPGAFMDYLWEQAITRPL
jgi:aldehyde dehydrogenase (NAD+)